MSVGRTGCTLVVLGQSSHEVALRAALEPPHGHRKYIYFDGPLYLLKSEINKKMGSQKLGAYEVRYKWKIQNSTSSVNDKGSHS